MKTHLKNLVIAAVLLLGLPAVALAQVPSVPPPYNVELGAVITNSARAPGTVTSSQQDNLAYNGVECVFNQTAVASVPSINFSIQAYDAASAQYQTFLTSSAIAGATNTPQMLMVYPGIQTSSLPSGVAAVNLKLPRKWRVSQTVANTGATTTGTIGCTLLK